MNEQLKPFHEFLTDWFASLELALRAALSSTEDSVAALTEPECRTDPDFDGWLHNDPMVSGNPASRYGDDAPGYLTGNGLGSLEIGAADD
jgi:hypothetical protein